MRNAAARNVCRTLAVFAAAIALRQFVWASFHTNRVLKTVTSRTEAALQANGDRAVMLARTNLDELQPLAQWSRDSVTYHLLYAANARILRRDDEAIDHYSAAIAADPRPEIYFDRGVTYLEEQQIERATDDIAFACRFDRSYLTEVDTTMQERVQARNKAVPYNAPPR